jgi:hypothetical protein
MTGGGPERLKDRGSIPVNRILFESNQFAAKVDATRIEISANSWVKWIELVSLPCFPNWMPPASVVQRPG